MGKMPLEKLSFGKLQLGKLYIWYVATWERITWEVALRKMALGKYLTPKGTVDVIFVTMNELMNLILVGMSSSDRFFTLSPSKLKHYLYVVKLNVSFMHNKDFKIKFFFDVNLEFSYEIERVIFLN